MGKTFCGETNRNICLVALAFFVYNLVMAVRREREDGDDGDKGEFRNGFQHNNCEIMLQIEDEQEQDNTRFGQNIKANGIISRATEYFLKAWNGVWDSRAVLPVLTNIKPIFFYYSFLPLAQFPPWLRWCRVCHTETRDQGAGVMLFTDSLDVLHVVVPPLTTLKWCCNKHYANIANIMYTFQSTSRLFWSFQVFPVSAFLSFNQTFVLGRCGTRI